MVKQTITASVSLRQRGVYPRSFLRPASYWAESEKGKERDK